MFLQQLIAKQVSVSNHLDKINPATDDALVLVRKLRRADAWQRIPISMLSRLMPHLGQVAKAKAAQNPMPTCIDQVAARGRRWPTTLVQRSPAQMTWFRELPLELAGPPGW